MPDTQPITPISDIKTVNTQTTDAQINAVKSLQKVETPQVGRPTVITEEVKLKLIGAFQNGMDIQSACRYAGIARKSYYDRINNDEEFSNAMDEAKDFIKVAAGSRVANILSKGIDRDAGPMARWALERTLPEMYGPPKPIQQNTQQNYYMMGEKEVKAVSSVLNLNRANTTDLLDALEDTTTNDSYEKWHEVIASAHQEAEKAGDPPPSQEDIAIANKIISGQPENTAE